jgi:zinc transport system permease protein
MNEFFSILFSPTVPFIRYALFAGLLSSAAFGVIGSLVVVKRISYIAGAISHAVLAGIGMALFFQHHYKLSFITPVTGAFLTALLAGAIISLVNLYWKQREDTIIGIIWAVGMAVGLLFISRTPGYIDPMSYLFGNILLIGKTDLIMIVVLDALVLITAIMFFNHFLAVSFDENFARVRGLNTGLYQTLLIMLTAVTVVLMVTLVGIVMVIALLTLPAAVAGLFTRRLKIMMISATLACMLFTSGGLAISYVWDAPSGAIIILFASASYLFVLMVKQLFLSIRKRRN